MKTRFDVESLQQKSIHEVREIFSTIPSTEYCIVLKGHFYLHLFESLFVAKALTYLPRHIFKVIFEVQYYYSSYTRNGRMTAYSNSDGPQYEQITVYTKEIGDSLKDYIASLPSSITSVELLYLCNDEMEKQKRVQETCYGNDHIDLLSGLPLSVKYLKLGQDLIFFIMANRENQLYLLCQFLKNIPDTVQSLDVIISYVDMYENMHLNADYKILLLSISRKITELILAKNELYKLKNVCFNVLFDNLSKNLKTLDLSYNELHKKYSDELGLFLSQVPPTLEKLKLCGNQLSTFGAKVLANNILARLPRTLTHLDIGENGLLLLEVDDFAIVCKGVPETITSLRYCEKAGDQSPQALCARLRLHPPHIKTLDFSRSGLSVCSLKDFVDVAFADLPESVNGLDLSGHYFSRQPVEQFVYFFSHLPPQIRKLILINARFGFEMPDLKTVLSALSPWISELDVSGNGFDRMPYTQMRAVLTFLPCTIKCLVTESTEFALRNDGAMVAFGSPSGVGLFKPKKRFYHQPEFAGLRIVMMQLIAARGLNLDVGLYILSYVINGNPAELRRMGHSISTRIISCVPPQDITVQDQNECMNAITKRIANLQPQDTCLDLSRCGLNRLVEEKIQKWFIEKIKTLPRTISTLSFRGNGLLHDDECREVFIALMKIGSRKIKCLDLSDNGFEYEAADELERLFVHLPACVETVRLAHEQPISPALQIARREWPKCYPDFADTRWQFPECYLDVEAPDALKQARNLLNEYTKDDSAFWRFLSMKWFCHHIEEVARLVHYIDHKLITSMEDLNQELEQIKLVNEAGSLMRRFSFLTYHQHVMANKPLTSEESEDDDIEFELPMKTLHG